MATSLHAKSIYVFFQNNDEGDMKPLILDALTQRSREEGVENIEKVEVETDMELKKISEETMTNATITEESSNNTTSLNTTVDLFQDVNSTKIVDTSDDRSDETANQIIVDEAEFEELPTDPNHQQILLPCSQSW